MSREIESRIAGVEGDKMHYLQAGTGQPLLLIHGLFGGSFCWRFQMLNSWLAATLVYAVDLPGLESQTSYAAPVAACMRRRGGCWRSWK